MAHEFYTLYDHMLHSETIVYMIMGISLVAITLYWFFITARDDNADE